MQFADDFNRPDETPSTAGTSDDSLGPDWVEDGDAEISSNTLKITSGQAICQTVLPDPQGSFIAQFETVNPQDGDIYELDVLWDGETPELKLTFEVNATNSEWIVSMWGMSSGWYRDNVELIPGCGTLQYEFLAGRTFVVSYDRAILRVGGVTPTGLHYEFWHCYAPPESAVTKIALVHGGGPRAIYFDNFEISDHYVHDSLCPFYGCVCGAS